MLLILSQTADRFGIALSVFRFEGGKLGQRLRLGRLLPDPNEFGLDLPALSPGFKLLAEALVEPTDRTSKRPIPQKPPEGDQKL